MTNNFDIIKEYMINEGIPKLMKDSGDLFFCVLLVRRGKDHKDLPAANYTFKSYYVDSIEYFERYREEMIKSCDTFQLRAYVSVNIKSKERYAKHMLQKLSTYVLTDEYKKPWKLIDHTFNKTEPKNQKTWIIDIDDEYLKLENYNDNVQDIIRKCKSKYKDPIITTIQTKSGYHLLTRPFNLYDFETEHKKLYWAGIMTPEVKKDHLTLLYENLN